MVLPTLPVKPVFGVIRPAPPAAAQPQPAASGRAGKSDFADYAG